VAAVRWNARGLLTGKNKDHSISTRRENTEPTIVRVLILFVALISSAPCTVATVVSEGIISLYSPFLAVGAAADITLCRLKVGREEEIVLEPATADR